MQFNTPKPIGAVADITLDTAKAIYRRAIDSTASDREGVAWWSTVAAELVDVICAESVGAAAAVIEWWHHDWSEVSDTPKAAAGRIRRAAREHRVGAMQKPLTT
ncbi:hypothetical protein [Burkholderia vietnamiensis]|uniref:hypothetical protein n=1 Tax=Burkholderia vietnamiensis TaxID=60552 RepID=UPI001D158BEC|nr:hypothetical protein [Burkholderia vietnamiensis]UEC05426.1 hypothetical protein LK462_35045 [Burkholderia vietnamiensis]